MRELYSNQVNLLLEILPYALRDKRLALKGGTAINLFHRNFPRLSVDIDICYLPLEDRETSFNKLHEILREIKTSLEKDLGLMVASNNPLNGKKEVKLIVRSSDHEVKIEPNFTLRSSLFDPVELKLSEAAGKKFEKSVSIRCLSLADTYGGKICAALDRQHPRDLFDIKVLFENKGITEDIKDSFLYHLISHNRPINELIEPKLKNIENVFYKEFQDMTLEPIQFESLIQARKELIRRIHQVLSNRDKEFLFGFVRNEPDWSLVRNSKIANYPSVKWKLMNQEKMGKEKLLKYFLDLKKCLDN